MVNSNFETKRAILVGETADVHFQRALTILRNESVNPTVIMEFVAERAGVFCGISEVKALLGKVIPETGCEVWALEEGEELESNEVALRVKAPYGSVGLYETAICGTLASHTGWATAARECVDAANGVPVVAFGARYMHPNVAAELDYASVIGGCVSCSTTQGARLAGVTPVGNMPHALVLMMGDALSAIRSFDNHMPKEVPRFALVGTFRDESEEALSVSDQLKEKLRGIRLDTPIERGGITVDLVKEVRSRLDQAGFRYVEIMVSDVFAPDKIRMFVESGAPVNIFGVGPYIAKASSIPFTADIREIDDHPVARRGRIPGITSSPRLDRVM